MTRRILYWVICIGLYQSPKLAIADIEQLSQWGTYPYESMAIRGDYAYIGTRNSLDIVHIADPTNVKLVKSVDLFDLVYISESVRNIFIDSTNLFLVTPTGLNIVDISNPLFPVFKGKYLATRAEAVWVAGNFAYLATDSRLHILDVSNPLVPQVLGSAVFNGFTFEEDPPLELQVSGNKAYVTDFIGDVSIYDISDPANPTYLGSIDCGNTSKVVGHYLYSGNSNFSGNSSWLQIRDISDLGNPILLASIEVAELILEIEVQSSNAFLATSDGFVKVDISLPAMPMIVGTLPGVRFHSLAVHNQSVFLIAGQHGIYALSDNGAYLDSFDQSIERASDIITNGQMLFVVDTTEVLVFDITEHELSLRSKLPFSESLRIETIEVWGNFLFVAENKPFGTYHDSYVRVMDISDPDHIVQVSSLTIDSRTYHLAFNGEIGYFVSHSGVNVVDLSDPLNPTIIDLVSVVTDRRSQALIEEGFLFLTLSASFHVYDISDPTHPVRVAFYATGYINEAFITTINSSLYLISEHFDGFPPANMYSFNIANPASPLLIGEIDSFFKNHVYVSGPERIGDQRLFVTDKGLCLYDFSNEALPTLTDVHYAKSRYRTIFVLRSRYLATTTFDGLIYVCGEKVNVFRIVK